LSNKKNGGLKAQEIRTPVEYTEFGTHIGRERTQMPEEGTNRRDVYSIKSRGEDISPTQ
jgi:hypothetical protein